MPAYLVAVVHLKNAEAFERARRAASSATTGRYGATFLGRGSRLVVGAMPLEVIEGSVNPDHVTVIEYPSVEHVRAWLASDEYRSTRALREGTADFSLYLVPGIDNSADHKHNVTQAST